MTTINLFRNVTDLQHFNAGQAIFQAGEEGRIMFAIVEGEVEIRVGGKIMEVCGVGGIIWEMALIDRHPRSATALAKTDCKLAPVDEKRFLFLVQQTPMFALQVMQIMTERLRHMNEQAA